MSDQQSAAVLSVRNFLGIRKADITLKGLNLVGSRNGGGKTSLINAATSGLLEHAQARGVTTKKAAAALVTNGQDEGSITVKRGAGRFQIVYPQGEANQEGPPHEAPTALALGVASFQALSLSDRMREISDRTKAMPVRKNLRDFLAAHEHLKASIDQRSTSDPDKSVLDDMTDRLMARIDASGWDAVLKAMKEETAKGRGRWEQITGQRWGAKKADNWRPGILQPGEIYDQVKAAATCQRENEKLETLLKQEGMAEGDRAALTNTVLKGKASAERIAALGDKLAETDKEISRLVAQQSAPNAPIAYTDLIRCPSCQTFIREVIGGTTGAAGPAAYRTFEAVQTPPPDDRAVEEKQAREISHGIKYLSERRAEMQGERAKMQADVTAANLAERKLGKAGDASGVEVDVITAQRQIMANAVALYEAIKARDEAAKEYAKYLTVSAVVDALEPDGVRIAVLRAKIDALNDQMAEICADAGFPPVRLDGDMRISFGEADNVRPSELTSRSEQWRIDFVFTIVCAVKEGVSFILLDELDMLEPDSRSGPLKAMQARGIGGIVCMMAKDKASVPSLDKAGMGRSMWITNGVLEPL